MVGSPTTNYWDDDDKITLNPPARLLDQSGQWIPLTMGPVANTLAFLRPACEADGEVATMLSRRAKQVLNVWNFRCNTEFSTLAVTPFQNSN